MNFKGLGEHRSNIAFIHNPLPERLISPQVLISSVTHRRSKVHNRAKPVSVAASTIAGPISEDAINALTQITKIRELMGHFLINIIAILCFYTVVIECTGSLVYDLFT